jgi:hypothetical protein
VHKQQRILALKIQDLSPSNYLDNLLYDDLCPIDYTVVPKDWEKILRGMLLKNPDKRMTVTR